MASVLEIVTETTCTWKVTNLSNCLLRASTERCTRSSTSGAPATVRLPVAGETLIWLSGGGAIVSISCWISFQSEVLSWTVVLCSVCAAPCPPCPLSAPAVWIKLPRQARARGHRVQQCLKPAMMVDIKGARRGRLHFHRARQRRSVHIYRCARAAHGGQGITREAHAHPAFTGDELTEFGQRNGFCTDNIEFTAERRRFRLRKRRWKNPLLRGVLHGLRRAARRAVLVPLLARRIHLYKRALFNIARVLKALASSG